MILGFRLIVLDSNFEARRLTDAAKFVKEEDSFGCGTAVRVTIYMRQCVSASSSLCQLIVTCIVDEMEDCARFGGKGLTSQRIPATV
jgi:hypothetical protein